MNRTQFANRVYRSCLVWLLLEASVCFAQEGKLSPTTLQQINKTVAEFMVEKGVPGVSVAVVKDSELAWSGGFGMADLENSVPATAQTLYRLASLSKPITAVAALRLWQQDKLDLDAPVQKYCPAFPEKKEGPITTRELLGHLAGIRHYRSGATLDPQINNTRHLSDPIQQGLDFFKNDPLLSKPGTEFHYSTYGYTLVGCVIEGASGEKYVDYVTRSIFTPAGMIHTQSDDRFAVIAHRTRFYQKDKEGHVLNADFLDSTYKIPGGGWLSSAEDMARFEIAVLNNTLLQSKTRDLMWKPQHVEDGRGYGMGWGTSKNGDLPVYDHDGGQQGTSTYMGVSPVQRLGIVVLTNMEEIDAASLGEHLMKILADH
jgi:serine beta-lactamase-like protein LACTB, mitochondrial